MSARAVPGTVLTPAGWMAGRVLIEEGRVAAVEGTALAAGAEAEPPYVLPGFVDLHVHGGEGADSMEGEAAVRQLARFHARHGTVALAPTTMTAEIAAVEHALAAIAAVKARPEPGAAQVLGAHLEGPFINPGCLGAQPPKAIPGDPRLAATWATRFALTVATVAPEIPGGREVVAALTCAGCRVQIGHSLADEAAAMAAIASGAASFTHLFNAMSGLHHRSPGVAAVALARGVRAEIIADLQHVHPLMIAVARRAVPGLYAVTDSTAAAGMPDGAYRLGEHRVLKRGERVVLEDGTTLAGSVLTMDRALRNLVGLGIPLPEAAAMTSTRPADYIGRSDLGRLMPGALASLVVLDAELRPVQVLVAGEEIDVAAHV